MVRRIVEVVIGIVLLVLAVIGAIIFQQQYRNGVEFHALPVSKAEIQPYTILTDDMFTMQDFPQTLFQMGGYAGSTQQLDGKIANGKIPAGLPIPRALVSDPSTFRLAAPNLEVVSIPITPPSSIGGQIRIGDKVNLYRLIPPEKVLNSVGNSEIPTTSVALIAGDVPVVEVMGSDGSSVGSRSNGQTVAAQILVVAVPPGQASAILQLIADTKANALLWVTLATVK